MTHVLRGLVGGLIAWYIAREAFTVILDTLAKLLGLLS